MNYINETWYELRESVLNFTHLSNYIAQESDNILNSAKLNYYKWFGTPIENAESEFKYHVSIVTNYIKQRFDRLTYLINTYDFADIEIKINFRLLLILSLFIL